MLKQLKPAIIILALFTLITGVIYPLVVTGIAQILFPSQANGSLIVRNGKAVGSTLIGQNFDDPKYFWGRLSDTGDFSYNAFNAATLTGSSGSNYGPMNPALLKAVQARIDALKAADPGGPGNSLGQRTRPGYQYSGRVVPDIARSQSARHERAGSPRSREPIYDWTTTRDPG